MNIIQTDNQLEIEKGATTKVILGGVFAVVGIIIAILTFTGVMKLNGSPAPWWTGLLGIVFSVAGVAIIFMASKTRIVFQVGGETQIEQIRIIGGNTTHESFPTASIASLQLETRLEQSQSTSTSSSGVSQQQYQRRSDLYLQLSDGRRIALDSVNRSISNIGAVGGFSVGAGSSGRDTEIPLATEGNQIAQFLNVQLNTIDTSMNLAGIASSVAQAFRGNNNPQQPQHDMMPPQQSAEVAEPIATQPTAPQTPPRSVDPPPTADSQQPNIQ